MKSLDVLYKDKVCFMVLGESKDHPGHFMLLDYNSRLDMVSDFSKFVKIGNIFENDNLVKIFA